MTRTGLFLEPFLSNLAFSHLTGRESISFSLMLNSEYQVRVVKQTKGRLLTLFKTTSTTFNFTFILCDIIAYSFLYSVVFLIIYLSLHSNN